MNFVARYGFAILIMCAVLLFGLMMWDSVAPHFNDLHNALSTKDSITSP